MFKIVIALVLLAHGIGHSMGLLQLFKVATINPQWHGDSWILTDPAGTTVTQLVGGLLWTTAIVGFVALAATVLGWLPASWFPPLAVGSAVVSLAGLLLFPIAFPRSARSARWWSTLSSWWRRSGITGYQPTQGPDLRATDR
jgi:hypothetical protein